jgi:MFS family permease
MLRAMPGRCWKSVNARAPSMASRTMSRLQRSPIRSRVLFIGQAAWSLWLVAIGVVVLDFAVQAVHVSNQHLLTMIYPNRTSSVVGGYMTFYSLGSALGATATTTVFATAGWTGSSILGAAFALVVWAANRRWPK